VLATRTRAVPGVAPSSRESAAAATALFQLLAFLSAHLSCIASATAPAHHVYFVLFPALDAPAHRVTFKRGNGPLTTLICYAARGTANSFHDQPETLFEFLVGGTRFFQRDPELGLVKWVSVGAAAADNRILEFQFANALLEDMPAVWAGERERTVILKHDGTPANDAASGSCTALSPIRRAGPANLSYA
jgi:hypothetical protein